MRKYVKELYSTEDTRIVSMYNSYQSTKGKADEIFVKNLYETLCSIIRFHLGIDDVLALCKSKNNDNKLLMVALDHKYKEGNYYTIQKDEEGLYYIEV